MKKTLIAASSLVLTVAASADPATYAIDPTHTFVIYEVQHFGTSTNRGRFDKQEGSVQFDRREKSGKVEIKIDTRSINTGVAALNTHLKGKDFFNSEAFPTATFVSDKFAFSGDKVTEVEGGLTLLGKTHPVTLKATNFNCYMNPMLKREVCGGDFETTIHRRRWGIDYGLSMGMTDQVRLLIQVEAVKQ